jgi:hypothetical protein
MLETLLTSTLAYENLIATEYQNTLSFNQDSIAIEQMIENHVEPNALQKKVRTKLTKKSKSSGFIQVLFFNKFKKFLVGESWEIAQNTKNKKMLDKISWKSPSHDFEYRKDMVTRSHDIKNIQAIEELRDHLDENQDKVPGVVGLLNRYSPHRGYLTHHKDVLPTTDLCYLGEKEVFSFYNNSSQDRPVLEIMANHFGTPTNEEIGFLQKIISLDSLVGAYGNYYFEDYGVECNLGQNGSRTQSFLSLFFHRKNTANPTSWNVTPVSYSPLSREIITQSKLSAHLHQSLQEFAYEQNIQFGEKDNAKIANQVKELLRHRRTPSDINQTISSQIE